MTNPIAYAFVKDFDPEPAKTLVMDHHYLLYAAKGAMRLEAEGQGWTLPPARAALIHAGREITITMPQKMTACSTLFHPDFFAAPQSSLSVFEMTPLARELVLACRKNGPEVELDSYAQQVFQLLAATTWRLAETPSKAGLPSGRSQKVKQALSLTEQTLADPLTFEEIASNVGLTPRTLARRFSDELGMTWRQALRRLRMSCALERLAEIDASITDVAYSVGYSSLSAFNAAFKDFAGTTPTEFRSSFLDP